MYFVHYLMSNCIFVSGISWDVYLQCCIVHITANIQIQIRRKSYKRRYLETFPTGVIIGLLAEKILLLAFAWCLEYCVNLPKRRCWDFIIFHMHSTLIRFVWPGLDFVKLFTVRFHDCMCLKNSRVWILQSRLTGFYDVLQFSATTLWY